MLLHNIKGPTSFDALKNFNGQLCQTYQETCLKLGLLENDQHWEITLTEAALTCLPQQIRTLFAIIITTCAPSDPKSLWEKYKENLSEDILRQTRIINFNLDITFSEEIFNEALKLIEDKCILINNKSLHELGLPTPTRSNTNINNKDLTRETQYDKNKLNAYIDNNEKLLIGDQKKAYDAIMKQVSSENGGIIFLDAPGGTGKTFLLNLILAKIRSQNEIAVAVASSGIAATLLDGGRTAHSTFKIPLNLNQTESPTCNIGKNSGTFEYKQIIRNTII